MATPKLVEEVGLLVSNAYPDDSGQNIVRLPRDTFQQLDVRPGHLIKITGEKTTIATAKAIKKADPNPTTIRIDGFARENAGADVGECVRVQRAVEVRDAETVTFELTEPDTVEFEPPETDLEDLGINANGVVHEQVVDRVLSIEDVVPIMPDNDSSRRAVVLTTTETEPEAPVYIRESTDVVLNDSTQS